MIEEFKAKLIEKKNLAPDVWFLKFANFQEKSLNFLAGQYLQLKIDNQRRCYSIASPENIKNYFELIVKFVPGGLASNFFQNLEIGQMADFTGPFGVFTLKTKDKNKIFFAGGTGIAPIRSQILTILKENQKAKLILFWGLKSRKDVYFFEEFKKISLNYKNFQFKICLDQEKNFQDLDKKYFFEGRVQNSFLAFYKKKKININSFEYYLCGPPPMVEALKKFLSQEGIKKENIFFEKF